MPFRADFDCLWCGRPWETRSSADLEGWAALCPDCLGKADDNGFLRMRLRTALRERATTASGATTVSATEPVTTTTPAAHDDWYGRKGRYSRGPIHDGPWQMELDEVTSWLDDVPMSGVIVELGSGSGWWSPLLAGKGELWLYDSDAAALDTARARLMAHGLLAHLHQRDPLAPADRQVDIVFAAYLLGPAADLAELRRRIVTIRAWLKPGGSFVFVEAGVTAEATRIDGPAGPLWPRSPQALRRALEDDGLASIEVGQTSSAFVFGRAVAPGAGHPPAPEEPVAQR